MLLDCETEDTAYASLEGILKLRRNEIDQRLDDYAAPSVSVPEGVCPWQFLAEFFDAGDLPNERHSATCWFHGTRTHEPDSFRTGILPLSRRIQPTWDFLYTLVADRIPDEKWARFRKQTERSQFGMPDAWQSKLREQGPCGFFVQEMLLKPRGHNYLKIPELVDHIAECFRYEWSHINLREIYWRATLPYVIKFKTRNPRSFEIGCALFYLYVKRHRLRMTSFSWAHFVGDGTPISGDDVINITSLLDVTSGRK
jgi:hypothetical protein